MTKKESIYQGVDIALLMDRFEKYSHKDSEGVAFWNARDLQKLLQYEKWDKFVNVIEKAKESCELSGQKASVHFLQSGKMVSIGINTPKEIQDYKLTRYACYLIAQNGDSKKKAVAFAQTYFAVQTRRQELRDEEYKKLSEDERRVFLRKEMTEHNKQLASAAKKAGVVQPLEYATFQNFGYKGLYNGLDSKGIKKKKGLKKHNNMLDFMGSTELAANLFRATQTEEKLKRENIQNKNDANYTHYQVGKKVRETIKDIGGMMPEDLVIEENVKKVEKRIEKQKKLK